MDLQRFIGEITGETADEDTVTVYRGHPNSTYRLKPTIFRTTAQAENEHLLLRDLVAMHPDQFASDGSALEMLVRMQHYSLPTRLLDATWNPLVAFYFACLSKKRRIIVRGTKDRRSVEADGQVVRLAVHKDLVRYFDSDTVSCLTNLAQCDVKLKGQIRQAVVAPGVDDTDEGRVEFNGLQPTKRLLHFIRAEKPAFDPDICPSHLSRVFLCKPKLSNRRILAQEGCFFVFGLTDEIARSGIDGIRVERIRIPADDKGPILEHLKRIAVNERTMFPEIERAARYLTENVTAKTILSRGT